MLKRIWNAGTGRSVRALLQMADVGYLKVGKQQWNYPTPEALRCFLASLQVREFLTEPDRVGVRLEDGTEFWGPEAPEKWLCGPRKTALVQSVLPPHLAAVAPAAAHMALLFNLVVRYVTEFSGFPFLPCRTHHLRAGDVFLDIGAFRGYVSVKAAHRVGPAGGVVAIEPMEENLSWIRLHQERNRLSQLLVLPGAVTGGQEGDQVEMFVSRNQQNSVVEEHVGAETRVMTIKNRTASDLLSFAKANFPNARRVIASITTNGNEMEITQAFLAAFPESGLEYLELTLPVIYTADRVPEFLKSLQIPKSHSQLQFPWLTLVQSRVAGSG